MVCSCVVLLGSQHIATARGIKSKSVFEVEERAGRPRSVLHSTPVLLIELYRTFRALWTALLRAFPSLTESLLLAGALLLGGYGAFLVLQEKFGGTTPPPHQEL